MIMDEYKVTYSVEKKGRSYRLTRSCDMTLPMFLWGGHALSRAGDHVAIEEALLERANKIKKPLKLEVIFQLSE